MVFTSLSSSLQKGGCSKIITSVWQFLHNTATIWNKRKDIPKKVISFHHLCGFCFIQTRVVDAFVIKYVNGYYREAAEEERKADLSLSLRLSGIQNKNCIYSTFLWQKFENMSPKSFCVCLFIQSDVIFLWNNIKEH